MMKVSVAQLQENIGSAEAFVFETSADEIDVVHEHYSLAGSIRVEGTCVNTGIFYRVEGVVHCQKAFQCDRCLEDFVQEQKHAFAEKYQKQAEDEADPEEDRDVNYFDGDVIDITDLIRDTILLAQPLNNICSPACRGLCMVCGANLNKSECGCDREVVDPRLAVLQQLLNKK